MKTPEEIVNEINDAVHAAPSVGGQMLRAPLRDRLIAAAIREAEVRGATWGIAAASERARAAHWCCNDRECDVDRMADEIESTDPADVAEKARTR